MTFSSWSAQLKWCTFLLIWNIGSHCVPYFQASCMALAICFFKTLFSSPAPLFPYREDPVRNCQYWKLRSSMSACWLCNSPCIFPTTIQRDRSASLQSTRLSSFCQNNSPIRTIVLYALRRREMNLMLELALDVLSFVSKIYLVS